MTASFIEATASTSFTFVEGLPPVVRGYDAATQKIDNPSVNVSHVSESMHVLINHVIGKRALHVLKGSVGIVCASHNALRSTLKLFDVPVDGPSLRFQDS